MSTHRAELDSLVNKLRRSGAVVEIKLDAEGRYDAFRVTHAPRFPMQWLGPLSFAECARKWIYRHSMA